MNVNPYLSFEGRCEEAIEFYKKAVGAEVTMFVRFNQAPPGAGGPGEISPGSENKIMHSALRIGDSTVFASDGRCTGKGSFDGISLSLAASGAGEAEKLFQALSDGGKVCIPMSQTFFAVRFGMVNDRFGVPWMILAEH